jgi:hypothetical protein
MYSVRQQRSVSIDLTKVIKQVKSIIASTWIQSNTHSSQESGFPVKKKKADA